MAKTQEVNQVGKREDLRDIISLIDARSCPLTSMATKGMGAPENTLVEWLVDAYPSPSFDGHLETEDVSAHEDMAAQRARLKTRIQIFQRSPMVGRLAERSNVAGLGKNGEMARAITKSFEMIKRDIESALGSDRESQVESGINPYRTRGLGKWIQSTAQTDLPVDSAYLTPAASIDTTVTSSLTEALVNAVLASVWDQTGQSEDHFMLVCGRALRSRFSSFSQTQFSSTNVASSVRMLTQGANERKLTATIDVYEGDFGTIELIPTAFNAADSAVAVQRARGYLFKQEQIALMYQVPATRQDLKDGGGGPRELIWCSAALCVKNPLGLGKFAATS